MASGLTLLHPDISNLEDLVQIARETAGDNHHFQIIQLPLNLAMTEAVRAPTQTVKGQVCHCSRLRLPSACLWWRAHHLMQSQLTRGLPAQLGVAFPSLTTDAQRALAFARTLPLCAALVGMRSLDHLSRKPRSGKRSHRNVSSRISSAVVIDSDDSMSVCVGRVSVFLSTGDPAGLIEPIHPAHR